MTTVVTRVKERPGSRLTSASTERPSVSNSRDFIPSEDDVEGSSAKKKPCGSPNVVLHPSSRGLEPSSTSSAGPPGSETTVVRGKATPTTAQSHNTISFTVPRACTKTASSSCSVPSYPTPPTVDHRHTVSPRESFTHRSQVNIVHSPSIETSPDGSPGFGDHGMPLRRPSLESSTSVGSRDASLYFTAVCRQVGAPTVATTSGSNLSAGNVLIPSSALSSLARVSSCDTRGLPSTRSAVDSLPIIESESGDIRGGRSASRPPVMVLPSSSLDMFGAPTHETSVARGAGSQAHSALADYHQLIETASLDPPVLASASRRESGNEAGDPAPVLAPVSSPKSFVYTDFTDLRLQPRRRRSSGPEEMPALREQRSTSPYHVPPPLSSPLATNTVSHRLGSPGFYTRPQRSSGSAAAGAEGATAGLEDLIPGQLPRYSFLSDTHSSPASTRRGVVPPGNASLLPMLPPPPHPAAAGAVPACFSRVLSSTEEVSPSPRGLSRLLPLPPAAPSIDVVVSSGRPAGPKGAFKDEPQPGQPGLTDSPVSTEKYQSSSSSNNPAPRATREDDEDEGKGQKGGRSAGVEEGSPEEPSPPPPFSQNPHPFAGSVLPFPNMFGPQGSVSPAPFVDAAMVLNDSAVHISKEVRGGMSDGALLPLHATVLNTRSGKCPIIGFVSPRVTASRRSSSDVGNSTSIGGGQPGAGGVGDSGMSLVGSHKVATKHSGRKGNFSRLQLSLIGSSQKGAQWIPTTSVASSMQEIVTGMDSSISGGIEGSNRLVVSARPPNAGGGTVEDEVGSDSEVLAILSGVPEAPKLVHVTSGVVSLVQSSWNSMSGMKLPSNVVSRIDVPPLHLFGDGDVGRRGKTDDPGTAGVSDARTSLRQLPLGSALLEAAGESVRSSMASPTHLYYSQEEYRFGLMFNSSVRATIGGFDSALGEANSPRFGSPMLLQSSLRGDVGYPKASNVGIFESPPFVFIPRYELLTEEGKSPHRGAEGGGAEGESRASVSPTLPSAVSNEVIPHLLGQVAPDYFVDPAEEEQSASPNVPPSDSKINARLLFDPSHVLMLSAEGEVGRYLARAGASGLHASDEEDEGACGCDEAFIGKDYLGADCGRYHAHAMFKECAVCQRHPACFLCMHCLKSVCPLHVPAHHQSDPNECTLFMNLLDIMTGFDRIFWCEKCHRFTWKYTEVFDAFVDQMAYTRGTYWGEPIRDIHCVWYETMLRDPEEEEEEEEGPTPAASAFGPGSAAGDLNEINGDDDASEKDKHSRRDGESSGCLSPLPIAPRPPAGGGPPIAYRMNGPRGCSGSAPVDEPASAQKDESEGVAESSPESLLDTPNSDGTALEHFKFDKSSCVDDEETPAPTVTVTKHRKTVVEKFKKKSIHFPASLARRHSRQNSLSSMYELLQRSMPSKPSPNVADDSPPLPSTSSLLPDPRPPPLVVISPDGSPSPPPPTSTTLNVPQSPMLAVGRPVSRLSAFSATAQGWRSTQEDAEAVFLVGIPALAAANNSHPNGGVADNPVPTSENSQSETGLGVRPVPELETMQLAVYCVFDGHGGDAVAKLAAQHFESHLRLAIARTRGDDIRARALLYVVEDESSRPLMVSTAPPSCTNTSSTGGRPFSGYKSSVEDTSSTLDTPSFGAVTVMPVTSSNLLGFTSRSTDRVENWQHLMPPLSTKAGEHEPGTAAAAPSVTAAGQTSAAAAAVTSAEMEFLRCYFASIMEEAFLSLDKFLMESEAGVDFNTVGCTACVVGVTRNFVLCANVGDSCAALYDEDSIELLIERHRLSDPREQRRVEAAGYSVVDGRIEGLLAVPRALGDYDFKQCGGRSPHEQAVCAVPSVTIRAVPNRPDGKWGVIVACDGIWDTLTLHQLHFALTHADSDPFAGMSIVEAVMRSCELAQGKSGFLLEGGSPPRFHGPPGGCGEEGEDERCSRSSGRAPLPPFDTTLLQAAAGVFAQCVAPKDNAQGIGLDNCSLIVIRNQPRPLDGV